MEQTIHETLLLAADILRNAHKTVVFTGAGISVESGVPPFRGPGGIWETYDQSILDIDRYFSEPDVCWRGIKELFYSSMTAAQPNDAHLILGRWERAGRVAFTITQNIDGLHQKGGITHIAEFHGNANSLVCRSCGARWPVDKRFLDSDIPLCPSCGAVLKPDFIFFGEGIPQQAAEDSYSAAETCDCMIVIGSSGEVYPAAGLPQLAKRAGSHIIEINPRPSAYTNTVADVTIASGAVDALRELDKLLTGNGNSVCHHC